MRDIGVFKPWTPPAASTAVVAAPVVAAPVAPPPAPEPPKPSAPAVGAEQYDKFVAEGPYTQEGRVLLQLIGSKAPDYCLPLLRRTVVGAILEYEWYE